MKRRVPILINAGPFEKNAGREKPRKKKGKHDDEREPHTLARSATADGIAWCCVRLCVSFSRVLLFSFGPIYVFFEETG
jgi:hypothetical protein